jgi:DNA-directed RNA polymerase specialized sigma24 family protein
MPIIQEVVKNSDNPDDGHITINRFEEENCFEASFGKEEQYEMEGLYENVIERMKDLPDIYKDILFDREILRMKYQDIADKHGMKKRAIATRIRRARLKVREMFPGTNLTFND